MTDILENYESTNVLKKAKLVTKDMAQLVYGNIEVPGAFVHADKDGPIVSGCNCNCNCSSNDINSKK
jgi:hypothetical protein